MIIEEIPIVCCKNSKHETRWFPLPGIDLQVKALAENCRNDVQKEMEKRISSNRLSMAQVFDTFYIPIPKTSPQKFKTQYDKLTDELLRIILDNYLEKDKRLFNDRTRLAAARNTNPYLLQKYSRDTGEQLADLSVPIRIQGKHSTSNV